jgi:hypothetical protein
VHGAELLARVAAHYPGPRLSPLLPVDVSDRATSPPRHGIVSQAAARVKQQSHPPPLVTAQALRAALRGAVAYLAHSGEDPLSLQAHCAPRVCRCHLAGVAGTMYLSFGERRTDALVQPKDHERGGRPRALDR